MATQSPDRDDERLLGGPSGRLLLLLSLGTGVFTLGRQLVPPLLPAIISDLGITSFEAGVALSVMSVATALSQYPSGRLSDQLSRETMVYTGVSVFIVGAVIVGVTPGFVGFLLGLTIFGAANGLYTPAARAKISDLFYERRGQAFGVNMSFLDVGGVTAAGLAVTAMAVTSWRMGFLVAAGLMALLLASVRHLDRERLKFSGFDIALVETGRRLLSTPGVKSTIVTYALFLFVYRGIVGFLPAFLQTERGFSPPIAAGTFALLFAMGIVSKPIAGGLSDRFPRPIVGIAAILLSCVGLGVLITSPVESIVLLGVAILAAGQKAFFPPVEAHLLDNFEHETMGGDLGAIRTVYLAFSSLGPLFVGFVAVEASYTMAFAGLLICLLAGVVPLLWDAMSSSV